MAKSMSGLRFCLSNDKQLLDAGDVVVNRHPVVHMRFAELFVLPDILAVFFSQVLVAEPASVELVSIKGVSFF